jgi:hypothetical protein
MIAPLRLAGLFAVVLGAISLAGCGSSNRSTGSATFAVGDQDGSWTREVRYSADRSGSIKTKETDATIRFPEGTVVVEKERVLVNEQEAAKLPAGAKVVAIDLTAGLLTITADGEKIHSAPLRK